MSTELYKLRFPIGEYAPPKRITPEQRNIWIDTFAELPAKLSDLAGAMTPQQLARPYRPGGWTGFQVIHHIADSHINSYMRFKLALTEDRPSIRPYDEKLWAEMEDARSPEGVCDSLEIIHWVHARLSNVFRSMSDSDWHRTFHHPEHDSTIALDWNLGQYAWHGEHHLGHLRLLAV